VETLEISEFSEVIPTGDSTLELEMIGGSRLPFSVYLDYFAISGASSSDCSVKLTTVLTDSKIKEGNGSEVVVTIENLKSEAVPMTVAIVGIPGGLEVRHEKLKDLVESKVVDYYETNGREVIFYWRYLQGQVKKSFNVDVIAAIPGTYTGPASRAYLYYTNEYKNWVSGIKAEIH